jgi:hypothetical protein
MVGLISTPAKWSLWDYRQLVATSKAAAGGIADAVLTQVPQDELWLLDRVVVVCTSSSTTSAFLYLNTADDRNVLDGTQVGNFDVADQSSPIQLPGGSTLLCRWAGASNGAVGTIRAQVTVMKQTG